MNLSLRKRWVKCYLWNILSYGCKTWTMGRSGRDRIETFEIWVWRKLERINYWTDRMNNEEIIIIVKENTPL